MAAVRSEPRSVWGEEAPFNATKSLQVLVSRTRSACGEQVQRAHRHLLALDQPVRSGVRYDASKLGGTGFTAVTLR